MDAKQYVQSDWCNQGQNAQWSHARWFAAPEIWNNIDGATEQRETGTSGQLERTSFFLLGDERGQNFLQRNWSTSAFRRHEKHEKHEHQGTKMTASGSYTSSHTEHMNPALVSVCRQSECVVGPHWSKLLNLRGSQVDLLPSSGENWKSRTNLWLNCTLSPWWKSKVIKIILIHPAMTH